MSVNAIKWEWEINGKTSLWGHDLAVLWGYRHLLAGLVRRNFLLKYQQTVLGPFWVLFQPLMTLVTFVLVFDTIVGIPTGELPPVVFYASGIILWNFFSESLTGTSSTFTDNAQLFNKVYFPRIIIPVSVITTQLLRFLIQLLMFLVVIGYYSLFEGLALHLSWWLLAFPFAIVFIGAFGLGMGLLFSVLSAKYRDIKYMVVMGVRLVMFVTPVIYPLSAVTDNLRWMVQLNPLTQFFELFRLSLLGQGHFTMFQLVYSIIVTLFLLVGAILVFNKTGDKLIDVL